jgi:cyclophilin family peptidyl-prolyl cis-trans isomerase/HEAT repeat protein
MQVRRIVCASLVLCATSVTASAQSTGQNSTRKYSQDTLIQILYAEDERRWDEKLKSLLTSEDAAVRKRAALASGRIGSEDAVPVLAEMLLTDRDADVRQMAAFALGEIESAGSAYALVEVIKKTYFNDQPNIVVRARALEALGKVTAALISNAPPAPAGSASTDDERLITLRTVILDALQFEGTRRPQGDRLTLLLGLTAVFRAKPDGAGPVVVKFLDSADPAVVATALNTMARLRLKEANERVRQLLNNGDPIVRANAARVIGAAEHKDAFDDLLTKALNDSDLRVRVSAIRALSALNDQRATGPLLRRAQQLTSQTNALPNSSRQNEGLELATTLGRINQRAASPQVELIKWLSSTSEALGHRAVELEIASARVSPSNFITFCETDKFAVRMVLTDWQAASRLAQGLGEIARIEKGDDNQTSARAADILRAMLNYKNSGIKIRTLVAVHSEYAIPDILQAYAAFKPKDLSDVVGQYLTESDVVVRATAAEILGNQAAGETNTRALIEALPRALQDKDLNDAALAILSALGKQKNAAANDAIKTALNSNDHLVRRRAVALLKANGSGDFSDRIGTVQTRNTLMDYRRALARIGKKVTATIVTSKGPFTIEFLSAEAPLTVDNFIQLARKGYFNGQSIPRVVPNFVIQAGDPRGDQNGGPGYSIRCEINEVPYERASVGMALSGKDTGGSQWFVTHSPQPHLDGGYTVFGRVISGMDVVDNIARGDLIRRVVVNEK